MVAIEIGYLDFMGGPFALCIIDVFGLCSDSVGIFCCPGMG